MVRSGQRPPPVFPRSHANECAQWPLNSHASRRFKMTGTSSLSRGEDAQVEIGTVQIMALDDVRPARWLGKQPLRSWVIRIFEPDRTLHFIPRIRPSR